MSTCINKNNPEIKKLLSITNSEFLLSRLLESFKTEFPSPSQVYDAMNLELNLTKIELEKSNPKIEELLVKIKQSQKPVENTNDNTDDEILVDDTVESVDKQVEVINSTLAIKEVSLNGGRKAYVVELNDEKEQFDYMISLPTYQEVLDMKDIILPSNVNSESSYIDWMKNIILDNLYVNRKNKREPYTASSLNSKAFRSINLEIKIGDSYLPLNNKGIELNKHPFLFRSNGTFETKYIILNKISKIDDVQNNISSSINMEEATKLNDITELKLSQLLIEYLKPFGVTFKNLETLNKNGMSNSYIIDTLSKLAYIDFKDLDESTANAAGHMIFELIGRNSYLGKLILGKIQDGERTYKTEIVNIDGQDYDMAIEVIDRYTENKTKYPTLSKQQLLIHTAGNIITDALKENKRKSSSFLQKVYDYVQNVINNLFGGKIDTIGEQLYKKGNIFQEDAQMWKNVRMSSFSLQEIANYIASSVLMNKDILIDTEIPKDFVHHSFEKSMEESPELKYIHSKIMNSKYKDNFGLVGSIAFRKVGTVYRHKDELIHDIDYFTTKEFNSNFESVILSIFPNAVKSHNDWEDDRINTTTVTYAIPIGENAKITNYKKEIKPNGDWGIGNIELNNPDSKYVMVDFFIPNINNTEQRGLEDGVTRFDGSFVAKINYGRPKDLKDFRNFVLFNPDNNKAVLQQKSFNFSNISDLELELIEKELINNNQLTISCQI